METKFLKDALFAGMTAGAFKLGTVLTLGWFWLRGAGCSVLYRGEHMNAIDFGNVLAVVDLDSEDVCPASYLQHEAESGRFYLVRRVNCCGNIERTLFAAVKVSIDNRGELAPPRPNGIMEVRAYQVDGSRIQLVWFYHPLDQASSPFLFNVYCDSGTGQMDYESPIASVDYIGQRYYCLKTQSLNPGDYMFSVRAKDVAGTEGSSSTLIKVQLNVASPLKVDILSIEVT